MSEMEFENIPEAHVPFVRDWFSPAYSSWARAMYGGRRVFFAWGWLFWLMLIGIAIKAFVFWSVVAVMFALFIFTAVYDMLSYRWRDRSAQRAALEGYSREVFQTPREEF